MTYQFLSDKWFDESKKIDESFGKIDLPEKLIGFVLNLNVTGAPQGDIELHFTEGNFVKGYNDAGETTLTLPYELCYKALLKNDTKAAMKGFLTRKIKIKGDMTKMLTLASIKAEGNFDALRIKKLEMTEPIA